VFVPAPPIDEPSRSGHPLIVTAAGSLRDELLRLSVAAGGDPLVAPDAAAARASWALAPLVLVGDDLAADLVPAGLGRRPGVVVVARDGAGADVYERAVALGAEQVLALPGAEPAVVQRIADAIEGDAAAARVFGVIGGRGGAGATTLAVALAVAARRLGSRTLLVDADPLGGGIDLALGAECAHGLRWPDLAAAEGRLSATALQDALLHAHDLTVLSWGRGDGPDVSPAAMAAVLAAGCRAHEVLVIDLPRHLDATVRVALERVDRLLLVVPAEVRAATAALRVASVVTLLARDVQVVVRGPAPADLSAAAVAQGLGLPLAGELRPEPRLAAALERGHPPGIRPRGPLGAFCARYLDRSPAASRRELAA
jgi:secretion/DNA translocation related CpaE-like protein